MRYLSEARGDITKMPTERLRSAREARRSNPKNIRETIVITIVNANSRVVFTKFLMEILEIFLQKGCPYYKKSTQSDFSDEAFAYKYQKVSKSFANMNPIFSETFVTESLQLVSKLENLRVLKIEITQHFFSTEDVVLLISSLGMKVDSFL